MVMNECDHDARFAYKSRRVDKYATGHTYRHIKTPDRRSFSRHGLIKISDNLSNTLENAFEREGLLFVNKQKLETKALDNHAVGYSPNTNRITHDMHVSYSCNKKRRWLLPTLLESKANEQKLVKKKSENALKFEYEAEISGEPDAGEPEKFALYYYNHAKWFVKESPYAYGPKGKLCDKYFDNLGKRINKRLRWDNRDITHEIDQTSAGEDRRLAKPKSKRPSFKYGNRDRHTGIKRRNEVFKFVDQEAPNPYMLASTLPSITYSTCLPNEKLPKTSKCWRSSFKHVPAGKWESYSSKNVLQGSKSYYLSIRGTLYQYYKEQNKVYIRNFYQSQHKEYKSERQDLKIALKEMRVNCEIKLQLELPTELVTLEQLLNAKPEYLPCYSKRYSSGSYQEPALKPRRVLHDELARFYLPKPAHSTQNVSGPIDPARPLTDINIAQIWNQVSKKAFNISNQACFSQSIMELVEAKEVRSSFGSTIQAQLNKDSLPSKLIVKVRQSRENLDVFAINVPALESGPNSIWINSSRAEILKIEIDSNQKVASVLDLISTFYQQLQPIPDTDSHNTVADLPLKLDITSRVGRISCTDKKSLDRENFNYLNSLNRYNERDADFVQNTCEISLKTCCICYEDFRWPDDFLKLSSCQHEACLNCWQEFLRTRILSLKVTTGSAAATSPDDTSETNSERDKLAKPITCLHSNCDVVLNIDMLFSIIPIDLVNKYVEFYSDLIILRSRDLVYCPNKRCQKIVVLSRNSADNPVTFCSCGSAICNSCRREGHFPAFCDQVEPYFKDLKKMEEIQLKALSELYRSEGKHCPRCGNYMEKDGGCNHMSCMCGFQFCWLCLKDYYAFHTASNGYFCPHQRVELIKYDTSRFMVSFSSLSGKNQYLTEIISEYRRKRNSERLQVSKFKKLAHLIWLHSAKADRKKPPSESDGHCDLKSALSSKQSIFQQLMQFGHDLNELGITIEYLAYLLTIRNGVRLFYSNYQFKINLLNGLKKAVLIFDSIHGTIKEATAFTAKNRLLTRNYLSDYHKLAFLDQQAVVFIRNLKHLLINTLRLFEK